MTINNQALRELYAGLLTEMRARRVLIREILDKQEDQLPSRLVDFAAYELCYLQLRMLCELTALACLAAHGDIQESRTSKLLSAYEPTKILKALERLHPDFYPVPMTQAVNPPGSTIAGELLPFTGVYLQKHELIKLFNECGNYLHRGSTKKLMPLTVFDFLKIRDWHDKVLNLLRCHRIRLIDPEYELWGLLNVDGTGLGSASLMKRAT